MSLLAYFMAHAPAEPQPWFVPNMPPPPAYPEFLKDRTQAEADELAGWVKHCLDPKDMHEPRAREFAFSYDAYLLAMALHRKDVSRQRYMQWPAAWADAQLAILKGRP